MNYLAFKMYDVLLMYDLRLIILLSYRPGFLIQSFAPPCFIVALHVLARGSALAWIRFDWRRNTF